MFFPSKKKEKEKKDKDHVREGLIQDKPQEEPRSRRR
jgi:hypothetical protein